MEIWNMEVGNKFRRALSIKQTMESGLINFALSHVDDETAARFERAEKLVERLGRQVMEGPAKPLPLP